MKKVALAEIEEKRNYAVQEAEDIVNKAREETKAHVDST